MVRVLYTPGGDYTTDQDVIEHVLDFITNNTRWNVGFMAVIFVLCLLTYLVVIVILMDQTIGRRIRQSLGMISGPIGVEGDLEEGGEGDEGGEGSPAIYFSVGRKAGSGGVSYRPVGQRDFSDKK